MKRIAIFASGAGSNAEKVIEHFRANEDIEIALIVTNRGKAGVLTIAEEEGIPSMIIDRTYFYDSEQMLFELRQHCIDFVVLAGFLWLIPKYLIKFYQHKIVNIHPSLLPKFGGKGMYGMHVHQAVIDAHEKQSGISIHYVNEAFDEGAIIFQTSTVVDEEDTAEDVRAKVQLLEHQYFPSIIEKVVRNAFVRS